MKRNHSLSVLSLALCTLALAPTQAFAWITIQPIPDVFLGSWAPGDETWKYFSTPIVVDTDAEVYDIYASSPFPVLQWNNYKIWGYAHPDLNNQIVNVYVDAVAYYPNSQTNRAISSFNVVMPEPSSLSLLGFGLFLSRRRR